MALGEMYEKGDRKADAKKCYWKAHCVGDMEGQAIVKLAALTLKEESKSGHKQAAALYRMFLQQLETQGVRQSG